METSSNATASASFIEIIIIFHAFLLYPLNCPRFRPGVAACALLMIGPRINVCSGGAEGPAQPSGAANRQRLHALYCFTCSTKKRKNARTNLTRASSAPAASYRSTTRPVRV